MTTHFMIDLETLGRSNKAVITQIGIAVVEGQAIIDTLHLRVNPQSCVDYGLTMDTSTVLWWLKQSDAARKQFELPSLSLPEALVEVQQFMEPRMFKDSGVWGNGATFDNVILANAFIAAGIPLPWKYWQDSCYRTLKNQLRHVKAEDYGTAHNALDDAVKQAKHLVALLDAIK